MEAWPSSAVHQTTPAGSGGANSRNRVIQFQSVVFLGVGNKGDLVEHRQKGAQRRIKLLFEENDGKFNEKSEKKKLMLLMIIGVQYCESRFL